jgi:hypothetical protein
MDMQTLMMVVLAALAQALALVGAIGAILVIEERMSPAADRERSTVVRR